MKEDGAAKLIALVEDDPDVAHVIEQVLDRFGFVTAWSSTAADLLRRLRTSSPALCIIDLGLPDMDGIDLMKRIRSQSNCGILILTGYRLELSDRVLGLELGADDYVLKPFEPRELVARVRSILRRSDASASAAGNAWRVAEFGGWRFHFGNNMLSSPTGEEAVLSTSEADLLKVFISNPNRILQREQLLGSTNLSTSDRSVDVRVSRLRRRLEPQEGSPAMIKTVYGAGYLFLVSVSWNESKGGA